MPFAIEQLRHHAHGHGLRLHFFAPDGGDAVLLQTREFFLRKRRMQNQVAIDIKRLIHGELERIEADGGKVKVGAGVEVGAERFQLLADLERVARGRAFFQHALGETDGAGSVGWIPAPPSATSNSRSWPPRSRRRCGTFTVRATT